MYLLRAPSHWQDQFRSPFYALSAACRPSDEFTSLKETANPRPGTSKTPEPETLGPKPSRFRVSGLGTLKPKPRGWLSLIQERGRPLNLSRAQRTSIGGGSTLRRRSWPCWRRWKGFRGCITGLQGLRVFD